MRLRSGAGAGRAAAPQCPLQADCCKSNKPLTSQLNKFSVAPHHFLLCPVEEEPQALPPTPPELARVYSLVQASAKRGGRLLAFYNGGPGAGASQKWRHVQFVEGEAPLEAWVRNLSFERKGECERRSE